MYLVYSLLLGLGFLILLPRFVIDAFRHGKYVAGFGERMGRVSPPQAAGKPIIWLHCVSVGETQAARPLVKALKHRYPTHSVVVSTITVTGQHLARNIFKDEVDRVFFFPFDWQWTVRRTLKSVSPAAILLMETELWPGFLRETERQKIPVAMINGRLSDTSFRRYHMIKGFMRRVLGSIDIAVMQTDADADRLVSLGMPKGKTFVAGNLKFDAGAIPGLTSLTKTFAERFGVGQRPIILAASTHAPEERILLAAFKNLPTVAGSSPRLVIAPRHPERFNEVAALLQESSLSWTRRTSPVGPADVDCDVILLDTIGELSAFYPLAATVFVGGSIAKTGGHNILEPAAVGACVVTGPHTHNFRLIVNTFVEAEAVIQLPNESEVATTRRLTSVLSELLSNSTRREELGGRARRLVDQNRGATQRTLDLLAPILKNSETYPDDALTKLS